MTWYLTLRNRLRAHLARRHLKRLRIAAAPMPDERSSIDRFRREQGSYVKPSAFR